MGSQAMGIRSKLLRRKLRNPRISDGMYSCDRSKGEQTQYHLLKLSKELNCILRTSEYRISKRCFFILRV